MALGRKSVPEATRPWKPLPSERMIYGGS